MNTRSRKAPSWSTSAPAARRLVRVTSGSTPSSPARMGRTTPRVFVNSRSLAPTCSSQVTNNETHPIFTPSLPETTHIKTNSFSNCDINNIVPFVPRSRPIVPVDKANPPPPLPDDVGLEDFDEGLADIEGIWHHSIQSDEDAPAPSPCSCHSLPQGSCPAFLSELVEQILHCRSFGLPNICLLYTSPSPRDVEESRMPSSA